MKRTIVIGDIHGCIDEFQDLICEVNLLNHDRLILLGDLIDRGPDPRACIQYAQDLGAECVMGNHEEKALRWRKHEQKRLANPEKYKNPMAAVNEKRLAQWAEIPDQLWDWVATWPPFLHIGDDWTAVHAGAMPGVSFEEQKPNELMRLRYIDLEKMKMAQPSEEGEQPDKAVHWTSLWTGPRSVVYGHYTYEDVFHEKRSHPKERQHPTQCVGIDTGCVHGGFLTAAIFFPEEGKETHGFEIRQVRSAKVYAERRPWNDSRE